MQFQFKKIVLIITTQIRTDEVVSSVGEFMWHKAIDAAIVTRPILHFNPAMAPK